MSNAPSDRRALIEWVQPRLEAWTAQAEDIGITPAQAAAVQAAFNAAQSGMNAADAARVASKAATTTFYTAASDLRTEVSGAIRSITTYAQNNNKPDVYALAQINPPKPRGSAPPPAQPTDLRLNVEPDGSMVLVWKASNPQGVSGVIYQIRRALNGSTQFALIDTVGEKMFIDSTVPLGTGRVSYIVTGKRGQQVGPQSAVFTAMFGVGPGGGMIIASTSSEEGTEGMKLAA